MPTPSLAFANTLQDAKRLGQGIAFGGVLDEVIQCIPFVRLPSPGESITVPRVVTPTTGLAGWRAPGAAPTTNVPTDTSFTFNFRRIDSLSEDDVTLSHANQDPNSLTLADFSIRGVALVRQLAVALMVGADNDTTGFLGWENMTVATFNRTDVAAGAATAAGVLESLLRIDDACTSGILGNRCSAYVTTVRGRRNIERAAQLSGFELTTKPCGKLPNEVPYYRGRPVLVATGLADDNVNDLAPLYAVDFSHVFIVSSTGKPFNFGMETVRLALQAAGSQGILVWFHGACVVRSGAALVRTNITTTLSL